MFRPIVLLTLVGFVLVDGFGVTLSRSKRHANSQIRARRDVFKSVLSSERGCVYRGFIHLGTPPQLLNVVLDTGSSRLVVPRKGCKAEGIYTGACGNNTNVYDPSVSTSAAATGPRNEEIVYGTGSVVGDVYADVFAFTDPESKSSLALKKKLHFVAGNEFQFTDEPTLGLSFPQSGNEKYSLLRQAIRDGVLNKPIFTIFLKHCPNEYCANSGRLTFGEIDTENCGESLVEVPVLRDSFHWEFSVSGISFAMSGWGNWTAASSLGSINTLVDSGTETIWAPQSEMDRIKEEYALEEKNGGMYYTQSRHLEMHIRFANGKVLVVPSERLLRKIRDNYYELTVLGHDQPEWVLGDPFLQHYCAIHNFDRRRIGFAPVRNA